MKDRSIGRTIWNLFLAIFNATLILAIIVLFLAWRVMDSAEGVSDNVSSTVQQFAPVKDEVLELRTELEGTREDLATLAEAAEDNAISDLSDDLSQDLNGRLNAIEIQLEQLNKTMRKIEANSDEMINTAIDVAFAEFRALVAESVALIRATRADAVAQADAATE